MGYSQDLFKLRGAHGGLYVYINVYVIYIQYLYVHIYDIYSIDAIEKERDGTAVSERV